MSKPRTLRQLKLPLGITRIPASAVRDLMKAAARQPRRSKYGAIRTEAPDGREFDSKKEAERYWELRLSEMSGEISDLELQPVYALHVNGMRIGEYRGDFRYRTKAGDIVLEDVKSVATRTPLYRLKAKLVSAIYGVAITEVY